MVNSTGKPRVAGIGVPIPNQINNIGKVNPKATTYALYNLPEKDEYMTADLRNQIDTLRTRYYYDNCQASSFPRGAAIKSSESFQCTIPTSAQITFENWNFQM
jgi:hypothetical protein